MYKKKLQYFILVYSFILLHLSGINKRLSWDYVIFMCSAFQLHKYFEIHALPKSNGNIKRRTGAMANVVDFHEGLLREGLLQQCYPVYLLNL